MLSGFFLIFQILLPILNKTGMKGINPDRVTVNASVLVINLRLLSMHGREEYPVHLLFRKGKIDNASALIFKHKE
jgi:hypothetical protein